MTPVAFGPFFRLEELGMALLPLTLVTTVALGFGLARRERTNTTRLHLGLSLLGNVLLFTSATPLGVALGFGLGVVPAFARDASGKKPARLVRVAHAAAALAVALGLGLAAFHARSGPVEPLASLTARGEPSTLVFLLLFFGVLVRNGVFPFHGWGPLVAEEAGLGRLALLLAPQAGVFLLLRVMVPLFPDHVREVVPLVARTALAGSLYAALLGLVSRDLRRSLGWLFVSQSSLVLVGLEAANAEGVAGALLLWMSGALCLTGLALVTSGIEARLGRLDLGHFAGLAANAPRLGALFLLFGLGIVGIPGTMGFVAEDLLVHGVIESFPILGIAIVLATAANGYSILRAYFHVFGGPSPASRLVPDLTRRERAALLGLLSLVVTLGFFPSWVLPSGNESHRDAPHAPSSLDLETSSRSGSTTSSCALSPSAVSSRVFVARVSTDLSRVDRSAGD